MPADTLTISLTGPLADGRALRRRRGLRRLEEPGANIPAEDVFAEIRARLEVRVAVEAPEFY